MGREDMKRMGRVMAAGWPILQAIAKTPWLLVLILPLMSAITYDGSYKRDRYIPVVATGSVEIPVWGMTVYVKFRKLANGKGSILSVCIDTHYAKPYSWGLGIA
jgi:hypothetical protein